MKEWGIADTYAGGCLLYLRSYADDPLPERKSREKNDYIVRV